MPIYQLTEELVFPHPQYANEDGLLAIGGDLSVERLMLAYENGIFPWFEKGQPILWWSPNPRCVLFPDKLKVSKSMRQLINRNKFDVTINKSFETVINNCAVTKRKGQKGTWITKEMQQAYCELHRAGIAYSVEVWQGEALVGGLYGIKLGNLFFGESMFSKVSNASKYGFITFVKEMKQEGLVLIDCQVTNSHLLSLGAEEITREHFLQILSINLESHR